MASLGEGVIDVTELTRSTRPRFRLIICGTNTRVSETADLTLRSRFASISSSRESVEKGAALPLAPAALTRTSTYNTGQRSASYRHNPKCARKFVHGGRYSPRRVLSLCGARCLSRLGPPSGRRSASRSRDFRRTFAPKWSYSECR